MPDFSESITIDAPPAHIYALVSNLPQMPDWSPECTRVTWSGSSGAVPSVGTRFIGHNRAGGIRWFTQGEVIEAAPAERFSFRIHVGPIPIARWTYDFTPSDAGCVVTESWTDLRPAAMRRTFGWIFGDRHKRNQHGIHTTLANLKSTAEASSV